MGHLGKWDSWDATQGVPLIEVRLYFLRNAVGPLIGLWLNYRYGSASVVADKDYTLELIIIFGAVSMIIGLWCLGHKVITTVGSQITEVTAPR